MNQPPPGPGQIPPPGYIAPPPYPAPQGYVYAPIPVKGPLLPVEPTPYPAFWRAPGIAWWRPLLGLLVAVGVTLAGLTASAVVWFGVDLSLGISPLRLTLEDIEDGTVTPGLFLSNNVMLAALIPATLLAGVIVGQKAGYVTSIQGRMRWGWLGTCLLVSAVPLGLVIGGEYALGWGELELARRPETWWLVVGILLTTPLQAAGEEYVMRGLLPRLLGAWIPHRVAGMVAGALLSSVVFMLLHGAADPWLNLLYFLLALIFWHLTWRTGGLEAAIALHVVNNLLSLALLPWLGLEGIFDRSEGSAGPVVLVHIGAVLVAGAVILLLARRRGLPMETAPGVIIPVLRGER